jgi:hypothetical protein
MDSGTGSPQSCTSSSKDKHVFRDFGVTVPAGATVLGIEVRLDARADFADNSRMCAQLSWNGGTTWTGAYNTNGLGTSESTFILGGPTDLWGRTWSIAELENGTFRVRIADRSQSSARDFFLDWVAVRVTYRP